MNSIQTKTKNYVTIRNEKCVSQVVGIADHAGYGFRIYVAWEWKKPANNGVFGFVKSDDIYAAITMQAIEETCDTGWDISGTPEAKRIFKNMFVNA